MTRRKRQFWTSVGAAAVVAALGWAATDIGASALEPSLDPLLGTYRFVGGEKEAQEVERAIDDAVDELNIFIRGIARRRLKEPNLPTDELRISFEDGTITIARSGQPAVAAPASGKRVNWKNPRNGNELRVAHRIMPDGSLEQNLIGDRGVSTNVFSLAEDGRLSMRTTVEAEKLPSTIRFTTTYARK
jgi:hypothetical protein